MIANALTKVENGELPIGELVRAMKACFWEPKYAYSVNGVRCSP